MDELLTLKEAAARLRCSIPTVYRFLNKNELAAKKIGVRTFIAANELDEFLNSRPPYKEGSV